MTISDLLDLEKHVPKSVVMALNGCGRNFRYFTRRRRDLRYWYTETMKYSCSKTPNSRCN